LAFLLPFWGQAVEWGTDLVLEACQLEVLLILLHHQDCKEKNELAEIGELSQKSSGESTDSTFGVAS